MQPVSRQQVQRNKYVRITSFEGKNDSFRIATGDPAADYHRRRQQQQQREQQQPMAGAESAGAGEISPESSFTTVILSPVVVTKPTASTEQRDREEENQEEWEQSSSGSSPPTHPAFYSPRATAATGKENVCPSSMAAPFSSPLGALLAHKQHAQVKAGSVAETEMLQRFLQDGDGNGGEGDAEEQRVLRNVNINSLAAPSNAASNADVQVVSC